MYKHPDIDVTISTVTDSNGTIYASVRPKKFCSNKSRRVSGKSEYLLGLAVEQCAKKLFLPMNYYVIQGKTIGAKDAETALKEFYLICSATERYNKYEVTLKQQPDGKEGIYID